MKYKFLIFISYIVIFFNSNLLSQENKNLLKIGLLAPLSGEYKDLGNSLVYSLQMALQEINDKNVYLIPRDSGSNDKDKLNDAIKDMKSQGVKIIIGPINNEDFNEVKKYSELIFISPSNLNPEFQNKTNLTTNEGSSDFSNAIGKFLKAVNQDQLQAKEAVADIVTGKSENLHEAMAKVEESKLSFELMLEVRNKLIDAYKEIQRM